MGFSLRDVVQGLQGIAQPAQYKQLREKERELYQRKLRSEQLRRSLQLQYDQAQQQQRIRNPLAAPPGANPNAPELLASFTPKPNPIIPAAQSMGGAMGPITSPTVMGQSGEMVPSTVTAPKFNKNSIAQVLEQLMEARKLAHQSSDTWSDYKKKNF